MFVQLSVSLIALLRLSNQLQMSANKEILIYLIILPFLPISQKYI